MKVRIYLSGVSSEIKYPNIQGNIIFACKMLGLDFSFYRSKHEGFKQLHTDLNELDTLWIVNDSLPCHMIETNPYIIISRGTEWLWSMPSPTCIGRITQEMLATVNGTMYLMALIARNMPMKPYKLTPPTYIRHVVNMYEPFDLDAQGRIGQAKSTWREISKDNPYYEVSYVDGDTPKGQLPMVNHLLRDGLSLLKEDEEILLFTNSDICLTHDAPAVIRCYMESMQIDELYFHRVDVHRPLDANTLSASLSTGLPYVGADGFAFRRTSKALPDLLSLDLMLAREGWDDYWKYVIKNVLPFNICWHIRHDSEWIVSQKAQIENEKNLQAIRERIGHTGFHEDMFVQRL